MLEKNALKRPILQNLINFPVCLAPMVGLSHVALRDLVREYMPKGACSFWPTEMLSSRRLPHERVGETLETLRSPQDDFIVPQILGNDREEIKRSVDRLERWGIVGLDINMGCPVKKALRHNYGVALMGDPEYAARVVEMAVSATAYPVSVKLRAGLQGDFSFLKNFVLGLQEAGAQWVTLHPRTAEQKRRGRADWDQIRRLRSEINMPVIGNGDVQTAEDAHSLFEQTGCDMVMVGRALTARPWLMWQLGESWGWGPPEGRQGELAPRSREEEGLEFGRAQLRFLEILESYYPEKQGVRRFRFFLKNSHQWLEFGHSYWAALQKSSNYSSLKKSLQAFFEVPKRMSSKTQLRY